MNAQMRQTGVGDVTVTPSAVALVVAPTVLSGVLGALFTPNHRLAGALVGAALGAVGTAITVKYFSTHP